MKNRKKYCLHHQILVFADSEGGFQAVDGYCLSFSLKFQDNFINQIGITPVMQMILQVTEAFVGIGSVKYELGILDVC